jgi:hypothetical protein
MITVTFEAGNTNVRIVRISTDSTLTQVMTAGWYSNMAPNQLNPSDEVEIAYAQGTNAAATALFSVAITAGIVTLSIAESSVVLPTIANHIATYVNTSGGLGVDAATAINGGNIQAGLSGTAGTLASFPATASKGSLVIAGVANTGNTTTTLSNDPMGQASVINMPDPGNAIGQLMLGATATPFVNGNLIQASGTAGLMVDSTIATANLVVKNAPNTFSGTGSIILPKVNGSESSNAVTASGVAGLITTSSLSTAGGASYAITWTNTLITTTSVVLLTLAGGTNTTNNITLKVIPGSGTATLTIYNNTAATALNGTILISYLVI